MEQLEASVFGSMIEPGQAIHANKSAAIQTDARYVFGGEIIDECLQAVRREAEQCDRVGDILFYGSLGGGTSSGLGTLLI